MKYNQKALNANAQETSKMLARLSMLSEKTNSGSMAKIPSVSLLMTALNYHGAGNMMANNVTQVHKSSLKKLGVEVESLGEDLNGFYELYVTDKKKFSVSQQDVALVIMNTMQNNPYKQALTSFSDESSLTKALTCIKDKIINKAEINEMSTYSLISGVKAPKILT